MVQQGNSSDQYSLARNGFMPQEEMLEVGKKKKQLVIGIPKETQHFEKRVALTPEAVELLVANGHDVLIEKGAGKTANYTDTNYSELGGSIVETRAELYKADIILKVGPPTLKEIDHLTEHQTLISALQKSYLSQDFIQKLISKRVTAIAFEKVKDEFDMYPVVHSMSAIAGATSIMVAAEYLSNEHGGKGVLLGGVTGITPTEVVIIGAGTAAEFAIRAALGLGASIKVFDSSIHKLRLLQENIGHRLYTSIFHPKVLKKALRSADVLIGELVDEESNFYVSEDMVKEMKKGSVIVDISLGQGGCIETTECKDSGNPVFTKHGVIHYCMPNLPSRVSRTASIALSNVIAPLLHKIADAGGVQQELKRNRGLRNGVYLFNGILTNHSIGQYLGLPTKDIDLLMAAF
ncbi:MAG: alanine dehydrogenase [Bacteroidales bacterium]|nr:alanine dehydrogenase [Bacteroidales bacterium]